MRSSPAAVNRFNVLGVLVSAIDMGGALASIDGWIAARRQHYVCVTGVHGVMESQADDALKRIHNEAGLVTPDGMPLVWLGRALGFRNVRRVYGPDLMAAVCERSVTRGYRHYLYGGGPGLADRLSVALGERFPGIRIVGTESPPFGPVSAEDDLRSVSAINASKPDIVWVGLSTPKQERWMADHVGRVDAPIMIGVGAAFDFLAGLKRQAPFWIQRSGLEWLFRTVSEPRRLGPRYLRNNPRFVVAASLQLLGLRRYQ